MSVPNQCVLGLNSSRTLLTLWLLVLTVFLFSCRLDFWSFWIPFFLLKLSETVKQSLCHIQSLHFPNQLWQHHLHNCLFFFHSWTSSFPEYILCMISPFIKTTILVPPDSLVAGGGFFYHLLIYEWFCP